MLSQQAELADYDIQRDCSLVRPHLRQIVSFHPPVFRWAHEEKAFWEEFGRIQKEAGIPLEYRENHKHTDACHVYGFHDLRPAFVTLNAETLTADALQSLMQHRSYLTTQRYINMARQLTRAVDGLHVPEALRAAKYGGGGVVQSILSRWYSNAAIRLFWSALFTAFFSSGTQSRKPPFTKRRS